MSDLWGNCNPLYMDGNVPCCVSSISSSLAFMPNVNGLQEPFCFCSSPTWSVLHPGGPPPGSPSFLVSRGYGLHPLQTEQDSCPRWLPPVPLDLVSPSGAGRLSRSTYPLDLSAYLPPIFCPLLSFEFSTGYTTQNCNAKPSTNWKSLLRSTVFS